ncbi:MAG: hypothetical protein ACKVH1_10975, partial [Alphaproteobacteria bacterium]
MAAPRPAVSARSDDHAGTCGTEIAVTEVPPLLRVEHLTMRFGGLVAIDDLSFDA